MSPSRLFVTALFIRAVAPSDLAAQQPALGPSLTAMVHGGDGVSSSCLSDRHFAAIGLHAMQALVDRTVTLQLAARGFWIKFPSSCVSEVTAPQPPPADGTYIVEQQITLQELPFETTDLRITVSLPKNTAMLAAGAGMVWREGHNAPYFVAGFGIPALDHTTHRFGIEIEYQWLHLTNDLTQRTWQGGLIVNEAPGGTVHHWSNAVLVGMRLVL